MPKHDLEAQLAALTQEFVGRLVSAIRNASFAAVAALSTPQVRAGATNHESTHRPARAASPRATPSNTASSSAARAPRQTMARRAELGERVIKALSRAGQPLGVKAISGELGVASDLLAAPLRELRAAGRIQKHGDKRSTTYSAA
jgi:hypothetical protein